VHESFPGANASEVFLAHNQTPQGGGIRPDSKTLYVAPSQIVGKHLLGAGRSYRSTVDCNMKIKIRVSKFLYVCLHNVDRSDAR
jgi:hypothetical protein